MKKHPFLMALVAAPLLLQITVAKADGHEPVLADAPVYEEAAPRHQGIHALGAVVDKHQAKILARGEGHPSGKGLKNAILKIQANQDRMAASLIRGPENLPEEGTAAAPARDAKIKKAKKPKKARHA